jgi:hypothetical protein
MAEDQVKIPIKEINRFSMFTNCPGNPTKRSRLAWTIRDGAPRITVYTNSPEDASNSFGIISAPMNPETFFIFLDLFEKIALGPNGQKNKIDCLSGFNLQTKTFDANGEKTLQSEVWFGKDDSGIVWVSVVAPNRPKIKFEYRLSDFHKVTKGDGNSFTDAELSVLQAIATIVPIRDIYYRLVGDFRVPKAGGYNNSRQADSAPSAVKEISFDDDIGF